MKERLKQWLRSGFQPDPVANWEWFLMRLFFAGVVFWILQDERGFHFANQPSPNGLARFVDLTWLNQPWMPNLFRGIAAVLLVIYVCGFAYWLVLPLLVIVCALPHTLMNSQGYIFHGYQIVTLTILAQAVVAIYARVQTWRGLSPFPERFSHLSLGAWMVWYAKGMIVATYVTSALTKTINSKGLWIFNSRFFALDVVKSHRQEYYRILDPEFAGEVPMANWLIGHPFISTVIFDAGFFLELFAIVALRSRGWALGVGLAIIAFHRSVQWMMNLEFPNNELVILIFLINLPFWIGLAWTRQKGVSKGSPTLG